MQHKSESAVGRDARSSGPIGWAEMGLVPDRVIRAGIRRLNRQRLEDINADDPEQSCRQLTAFVKDMKIAGIAPVPELANEQHYEVPAEFFGLVMGDHRKYSSCYWSDDNSSLVKAEAEALRITCLQCWNRRRHARAGPRLWLGFPESLDCRTFSGLHALCLFPTRIASASTLPRQAIERGLNNITVITCDMNVFDTEQRFDRIVSVEMFEHMRN